MLKGRNKETKKEVIKRGSRKYGQARLKHSKKGMMSCACAAAISLVLLLLVYTAYLHRGGASGYIGGLGVSTLIFAWIGVTMGIRGLREREKNYTTCRVGIAVNSFLVLCFILLFFRGLM